MSAQKLSLGAGLTALAVVVLTAACAPAVPALPVNEPFIARYKVAYDEVYEFRLQDGTRCVIWDSIRAGGIDCGFSQDAQVEQ